MTSILWRLFPLLVSASLGLAGYWYVIGLKHEISSVTSENAALKESLKAEKHNVQKALSVNLATQKELDNLSNAVAEMNTIQMKATDELERLNDIFSEHNFGNLVSQKPGLLERRINAGTANSVRLLECATGKVRPDC